ncbi:hypothetical protein GHT07_01045 [Caenimonas koreensis DSM 17982]|uniref:Uncharacterized protein n=1 Tax=Caenimonas koreensis DSM 17982 TaxID=1121255 RepID=A0A844AU19_9BURK|nr:hypothetical protein [Caenimonas koreensis]MRD45848.1 hypothetical protein [Caenimonas koreensis DSM 17982]
MLSRTNRTQQASSPANVTQGSGSHVDSSQRHAGGHWLKLDVAEQTEPPQQLPPLPLSAADPHERLEDAGVTVGIHATHAHGPLTDVWTHLDPHLQRYCTQFLSIGDLGRLAQSMRANRALVQSIPGFVELADTAQIPGFDLQDRLVLCCDRARLGQRMFVTGFTFLLAGCATMFVALVTTIDSKADQPPPVGLFLGAGGGILLGLACIPLGHRMTYALNEAGQRINDRLRVARRQAREQHRILRAAFEQRGAQTATSNRTHDDPFESSVHMHVPGAVTR